VAWPFNGVATDAGVAVSVKLAGFLVPGSGDSPPESCPNNPPIATLATKDSVAMIHVVRFMCPGINTSLSLLTHHLADARLPMVRL
jgi:hypothetical protein